jgi:copper chaperone CopZ
MKSTSKIFMGILLCLSFSAIQAQIKNLKTQSVKIYGSCEMCLEKIEKAGNIKNTASVKWNQESQMAQISFDEQTTSLDQILKRIAQAGYDSDSFLAPTNTYAQLPKCCQYPRLALPKSTQIKPEMALNANEKAESKATADEKPLESIQNAYFKLKNALVESDAAKAKAAAKDFLMVSEPSSLNLPTDENALWQKYSPNILSDAKQIAEQDNLAIQRKSFSALSQNFYLLIKNLGRKKAVYHQFCPMANGGKGAEWLSQEAEIQNPYYGQQMLNCGKVLDTLK